MLGMLTLRTSHSPIIVIPARRHSLAVRSRCEGGDGGGGAGGDGAGDGSYVSVVYRSETQANTSALRVFHVKCKIQASTCQDNY